MACSDGPGAGDPALGASAEPACRLAHALHEHQLMRQGGDATPADVVVGRLEISGGPVARGDSGGAGVDLVPYRIAYASDLEIALGGGGIASVRLIDADGDVVAEARSRSAAAADVARARVTPGHYVLDIASDGDREQHYVAAPRGCASESTTTPRGSAASDASDDMDRKTPGVYVSAIDGFPASFVGASTSMTAFVGYVGSGAIGTPTPVASIDAFTSIFGAGALTSPVGIALSQFFVNGGGVASVVATASSGVSDVIGDPGAQTGVYALETAGEWPLLVLPDLGAMSPTDATTLLEAVIPHAAARGAFTIVDGPAAASTPEAFGAWVSGTLVPALSAQQPPETVLPFAAAYYPRIVVASSPGASATVAAGGAIAGAFAANDVRNGVWSAPAGAGNGALPAATGTATTLDDADASDLAANRVNAIRTLGDSGAVLWDAVTLQNDPAVVSVQHARTEIYLRSSIGTALAWVAFEPDDQTLWSSVTAQVSSFLTSTWQQGGLSGSTPDDAFQVICDAGNNPPTDVLDGLLHVEVIARLSSGEEVDLVFTFMTEGDGT